MADSRKKSFLLYTEFSHNQVLYAELEFLNLLADVHSSAMSTRLLVLGKVKFTLEQVTKVQKGGVDAWLYSFFNLSARWGGWSTPRTGRFTLRKDHLTIVQEAVYAPWRV